MRYLVGLFAVLVVIAGSILYVTIKNPAPAANPAAANSDALLPAASRPNAADFTGIDAWVNSKPLSLAALKGKVVLVDFWTFSCVNCVRTLPHLKALYDQYSPDGFVIVGVHSPEFDFEKDLGNIKGAVQRLGVTWPVAVDSEMATWNVWGNNVWPAEYLIDQQGRLAYENLGEGNYDTTATAVQALLAQPAKTIHASSQAVSDSDSITPEIYVGSIRGNGYGLADGEQYSKSTTTYPQAKPKESGHVLLTGTWTDHGDYVTAGANAHVKLTWHASAIYMVAGTSAATLTVPVVIDSQRMPGSERGTALSSSGTVSVGRNDLYNLAVNMDPGTHTVDISAPPGFEIFTFTFG